jgi:RimJ/RimL family protein N-acetyltransferase
MDVNVLRAEVRKALPISQPPLLVRHCERSDMDSLAAWPAYPEPYSVFTFSFADLGANEMDSLYRDREGQEDRMTLVADHGLAKCIGYAALLEIDWKRRESGNMALRVHPEWCGKGIGSGMLSAVRHWWLSSGMRCLCLDVASSNERAVRCYEKVGFAIAKEFWREAEDLKKVDLADPKWRFLDGHVRFTSQVPELRFLLMRLMVG